MGLPPIFPELDARRARIACEALVEGYGVVLDALRKLERDAGDVEAVEAAEALLDVLPGLERTASEFAAAWQVRMDVRHR